MTGFLVRIVLVPFYRGAVVFILLKKFVMRLTGSRPLLSRSGCIFKVLGMIADIYYQFSSPFIEERLYFLKKLKQWKSIFLVLVPFYRGAVVFTMVLVMISGF